MFPTIDGLYYRALFLLGLQKGSEEVMALNYKS